MAKHTVSRRSVHKAATLLGAIAMPLWSPRNVVGCGNSGFGVRPENQRVFFVRSESSVVNCVIARLSKPHTVSVASVYPYIYTRGFGRLTEKE